MVEVFTGENVNRIIIGLGGQGCRIVDNIATHLDSQRGIPNNEAFIFIDSHEGDLSDWCVNIKTVNPTIYKRTLSMLTEDSFLSKNPWFPRKYIALVGKTGAGRRRVFGKALYVMNRDAIKDTIIKTANTLKANTNDNSFVVILVGSLSGGTGSSIFCDLALDIREWINTAFRKPPTIFGFGILPSKGEDETSLGNSMATLKELHLLLSLEEQIEKYINPYQLFILVGREVSGASDDETLREIILRFFIDLGFVPGKIKKTKDKWFDLNDLLTASAPYMSSFSTIGYRFVEFPANKLLRFFESEDLIEGLNLKLVNLQTEINFTQEKINDFENQLQYANSKIQKLEILIEELHNTKSFFSNKKAIEKTRDDLNSVKMSFEVASNKKKNLIEELRRFESMKANLESELNSQKAQKNSLYQQITIPSVNVNKYQITLNDDEIDKFRPKEIRLKLDVANEDVAYNFKQVMDILKKPDEYDRFVHKPVNELSIASEPLLNYQHKMKSDQIKPNILSILSKNELIEIDPMTQGVIDEESKIGYVEAILSTHQSNIDVGKLGASNAQNILRTTIARDANLVPLHVPLDRFSVNIYTLMIGIHPWAPAQGYPSRLTDLDIMKEKYDHSDDERRFMHHSMFLGDFDIFTKITNIDLPIADIKSSVSSVIQFWKNYELVDKKAQWNRVPITIAEIAGRIEELDNQLSLIQPRLQFIDAPLQFSPQILQNLRIQIQNISNDLSNLGNSFSNQTNKFGIDNDHLTEFIIQFGSKDTVDDKKSDKIKRFLDTTSGKINTVLGRINKIADLLNNETPPRLQKIDDFIKNIPYEYQTEQIQNHMAQIGGNLDNIRPKIPEISRNLHQIGIPLGNIQASLEQLSKKVEKAGIE